MRVLILHGPNLNCLGKRETQIYGTTSLEQLNSSLLALAKLHHCNVEIFQENCEGKLLDKLYASMHNIDAILINPGALAHSSIALLDAFKCLQLPFIEIHLSNIYAREPFRAHSYLAPQALGVICGLGVLGYELGLLALIKNYQEN